MIAHLLRMLALGLFVVLTVPGYAETSGPPPASAFAHLPMISHPKLSPDGKRIAFMYPVNGQLGLLIVDAKKTPESKVAGVKTSQDEIYWYEWKTSNRLIVGLRHVDFPRTNQPVAVYRLMAVDADGGHQIDIWGELQNYGYGAPSLFDLLPDDPQYILLNYGGPIYKLDVNTTNNGTWGFAEHEKMEAIRFQPAFFGIDTWVADQKGAPRVGIARDGDVTKTYYRTESGSWDLINSYNWRNESGVRPIGLSDDGRSLYVKSNYETGHMALYEFDPTTKSYTRKIFSVDGYDIGEGIYQRHKLLGVRYVDDVPKEYYFDPGRAALQKGLDRALPNTTNHILQVTDDGKSAIIATTSSQEGGAYYLLTMGDRMTLDPLGSAYPDLPPEQLATVTPVTYAARDGQVIHAYLTVPRGMEGKPLPFIVLPHGGPTERDNASFDWWVQFLATRGYGVIQPNFRGSTGYGFAFQRAGYKEWGHRMQDDVSDAALWLKKQGLVKDDRICIGGWSYGGYSSLVGATMTPDLYRCSFSMAGVSDLWSMISRLKYFGGFTDENLPHVQTRERDTDTVSPITHVAALHIPVLLMHGEHDFTVPVEQSKDFEAALRAAGKSVEAVYFDDDTHYLGLAKNRLTFLNTIEAFLAKNLGPGELTQQAAAH